jgi:hypothetical protein
MTFVVVVVLLLPFSVAHLLQSSIKLLNNIKIFQISVYIYISRKPTVPLTTVLIKQLSSFCFEEHDVHFAL